MRQKIYDVTDALSSLYPNLKWSVTGYEYEGIEWMELEVVKPSKEEIENEVVRLQNAYDALEYQRLRKEAYPSFAEQFDILYHGGYDVWKATIDNIKNEYPKPTNS